MIRLNLASLTRQPLLDEDGVAMPPAYGGRESAHIVDGMELLDALETPVMFTADPGARLQMLQQHEHALQSVLPPLLDAARASSAASVLAARRAAVLAQQLLLCLHTSYKRVAVDLGRDAGRFFRRGPVRQALTGALLSAWRLQCAHARSYSALPDGFWRDCHQLFACIAEQGWERYRKPDGGGSDGARLGELYRRILLLGMNAANRLDPQWIENLIALVEREAPGLRLQRIRDVPDIPGAFVFRDDADLPPQFVDELPVGGAEARWWLVDLAPVSRALSERMAQLQNGEFASPQELQLLLRLQREWLNPPRRRHPRRRQLRLMQVELKVGLVHCWRALQAEAGEVSLAFHGLPLELEGAGEDETPAVLQVCNESSSGVQLEGEAPPQPLRAGELVMLREAGGAWRPGLVRWVGFSGEGLQLRCGVEFVGAQAEAVRVMPVISHPNGRYQMALRLRRGRVLLMPGRHFQPQREFLLADGQRLVSVRALRLLAQAVHYQVFMIKQGDELPLPEPLPEPVGQER